MITCLGEMHAYHDGARTFPALHYPHMRVALLSHRGANIGHDFMAIGMEEILRSAFGAQLTIVHFEQHKPFSVYPFFHPLRLVDTLPNGRLKAALRRWLSAEYVGPLLWPTAKRLRFDLAIACGGPNIIPGAGSQPMMRLMFHHMLGAFHYRGVPVVDAGVGSCFPWTTLPSTFTDPLDRAYFQKEFSLCSAIVVRDELAVRLYQDLGGNPSLIPCAAFVSGRFFERIAAPPDAGYALINFQERGANTDWGQGVDTAKWRSTVEGVITHLQQRMPVKMLCHSASEEKIAQGFGVPVLFPQTHEEYGSAIRGARVALVNRLHASIPIAGIGVPNVHVGTDSRMLSITLLGLPTVFVKEATTENLIAILQDLLTKEETERARLLALREDTGRLYEEVFKAAIATKY